MPTRNKTNKTETATGNPGSIWQTKNWSMIKKK